MPTSPIYQKLEADIITALKGKDTQRVRILRFLKSNLDTEAKAKLRELTDEEVIKVIQRRVKQSQDARAQFAQGGRPELAGDAGFEISILTEYLPAQLSDAELAALAARAVAETGATKKDFGRLMGRLVKEAAGKADGARIKAALERALPG